MEEMEEKKKKKVRKQPGEKKKEGFQLVSLFTFSYLISSNVNANNSFGSSSINTKLMLPN